MNKIEAIEVSTPHRKPAKMKDGVFVGKDILELISISMYVDPLTMFREYIQNATDSIDANASDTFNPNGDGRISVSLSQSRRSLVIRDNGTGISAHKFQKIMLSLGASEKRGTVARGFRGVGRFSGLGYCQQLIFRTKSAGEHVASEVAWDGRLLKRMLSDNSQPLSIDSLISDVASFSIIDDQDPDEHFFEVELCSIVRMGNDVLLNEDAIKNYLSQVAPVPYSDGFSHRETLDDMLVEHGVSVGYCIELSSDFCEAQQIFRPYTDTFQMTESEQGAISEIESFVFEGIDGEVAAIGWILHHEYKGIVPRSLNTRGIRVRVGNTQIGDETLLAESFPEPRFNSWSIGEIHILNPRVTPNGRRDNFDVNVHWIEIQNQFAQYAKNVARICRKNSAERNVIKRFDAEIQRAEEYHQFLKDSALSRSKLKEISDRLVATLHRAEKLVEAQQLTEKNRVKLGRKLERCRDKFSLSPVSSQGVDLFSIVPKHKESTVREVFDFIFECSPNKVVAQALIDKISDQYKLKYEQ